MSRAHDSSSAIYPIYARLGMRLYDLVIPVDLGARRAATSG